jgi:hypothetical protein
MSTEHDIDHKLYGDFCYTCAYGNALYFSFSKDHTVRFRFIPKEFEARLMVPFFNKGNGKSAGGEVISADSF